MLAMPSRTIPTAAITNKKTSRLAMAGLYRIISEAKDAFRGRLFVLQFFDHILELLDFFPKKFDFFPQVIIAGKRKYTAGT